MPVRITKIEPDSPAAELGLSPGDVIVSINGFEIRDYLDFLFYSSDDLLILRVKKTNGGLEELEIERTEKPLGIEVEGIKPRACRCRCVFCFMDQMPKGLRKSLYFKDDDYRLSFLFGNYITLTNLTEDDWKRIDEQRLSPLYVSVHASDPELRVRLMRCPEAGSIMKNLRRLVDLGITVHAQIVVCPGINDGGHLKKTILDLCGLFPGVRSVAVVPVGLTKHRENLFPLRPVERPEAEQILKTCLELGEHFMKELGTRFVFPADEIFIKAKRPIPPSDFYEDFFQIEDGVGMVRRFLDGLKGLRVERRRKLLFATGTAFRPFLEAALERAGLKGFEVAAVRNEILGETVTVAGLLFGKDITAQLKKLALRFDAVVLPSTLFNDDGLTLDDMTAEDLQEELRRKVLVAPDDPREFSEFLLDL